MKKAVLIFTLCLTALTLCACSSPRDPNPTAGSVTTPNAIIENESLPTQSTFAEPEIFDLPQVPEGVLDLYILESPCYESGYPYYMQVHHNYDSSAHIDTVNITLEVEYPYAVYSYTSNPRFQYDQSTDLWNLVYSDGWSDASICATSNLIGEWNLYSIVNSDYAKTGYVYINSVDGRTVNMDCCFIMVPENNELNPDTGTSYTYNAEFGGTFDIVSYSGADNRRDTSYIEIPYNIPDGYYGRKSGHEIVYSTTIKIELNPIEGLGVSSWFEYPIYVHTSIYHN